MAQRVAVLTMLIGVVFLTQCAKRAPLMEGGMSARLAEMRQEVPAQPTFSWISRNVLEPRCIRCHAANSNSRASVADFTSYPSIMLLTSVVVPGAPEMSRMYQLVKAQRMPPVGKPLSDASVQAIYEWILNGAPNN